MYAGPRWLVTFTTRPTPSRATSNGRTCSTGIEGTASSVPGQLAPGAEVAIMPAAPAAASLSAAVPRSAQVPATRATAPRMPEVRGADAEPASSRRNRPDRSGIVVSQAACPAGATERRPTVPPCAAVTSASGCDSTQAMSEAAVPSAVDAVGEA